MVNAEQQQRMSLSVHEVIGIGTVVVAIITSFLFLRAEVMLLSRDVSTLQTDVKNIIVEQAKMKATLDLMYDESVRSKRNENYNNSHPH